MMKVDQKGHTTIIKHTENSLEVFVEKVSSNLSSYKEQNIIIDLLHQEIYLADLKSFSEIAKSKKKDKKSFVIVVKDIDFNKVPSSLHVVPSVLEAKDIIEMEEIERDLGF